jgi:esterase/lipase superfamily enzyme
MSRLLVILLFCVLIVACACQSQRSAPTPTPAPAADPSKASSEPPTTSERPKPADRQPASQPAPPPPPPAQTVSTEEQDEFTKVDIFYATDRKRGSATTPANYYSAIRNDIANALPLEYGKCVVSIPAIHRTGEMESPTWWKLEFKPDPEKHIVLLSVTRQSGNSFYVDLKAAVNRSSDRDAFVFIHGYNTTFQDAARRTAQIAYDLKFHGAPILYSWPSQGKASKYIVDEAAVEWSTEHLKEFLNAVRRETGASKIHLIAHSMGNRALIHALEAIPEEQKPIFRSIVLAAPDIDAGLFGQLAAKFTSKADRVTLYASSKDEALALSKKIHGYPRAGETDNGVLILPHIDTIDASAVKTDFLGHSYFDSIVPDMFVLFQYFAPPDRRPKLIPRTIDGKRYWMIQP